MADRKAPQRAANSLTLRVRLGHSSPGEIREACVPHTKAHFPSQPAWQYESSPQTPKTVDEIQRRRDFIAVRTGDTRQPGKKTAGVDGVKSVPPNNGLPWFNRFTHNEVGKNTSQPVRRIYIPKPGKDEKRPLGIPTMLDRAHQHLVNKR